MPSGSDVEPVDRERERVGRLVDAEVLRASARGSRPARRRRARARPIRCPRPRAPAGELDRGRPRPPRLPERFVDLDLYHRLRCVPVCSACCLYASTIRCTSLCRTTSSWPNSTKAMPSTVAEDLAHLDQPRRLLPRQVDLRHVAGDDHLRAEAEPRQEHLHLLGRGVLRLVEDDEAVVQCPAAHEGQRRHLDRAALHVRVELLRVHRVVERVEERAHVRVDLREHVAGEEAEPLARLDRGAGEDDAGRPAARRAPQPRARSRGTSCRSRRGRCRR